MPETTTILRQQLEAQRVISFARFMDLALYCPNSGYYEQTERRIGRTGDFFTSVSVGPLFGRLLAFQFAHWLEALGACEVTEAGAHNGQLAADILGWLRQARPRLFQQLRYRIIEPSASRRDWQQTKLADFAGQVEWAEDLPRLPARSWDGVMFANELLDAFPVHRLGLGAGDRAPAPAAYVRARDLSVERLEQEYVRACDEGRHQRYDYAAPVFDFAARLVYDEAGLVLDYPGIALRAV